MVSAHSHFEPPNCDTFFYGSLASTAGCLNWISVPQDRNIHRWAVPFAQRISRMIPWLLSGWVGANSPTNCKPRSWPGSAQQQEEWTWLCSPRWPCLRPFRRAHKERLHPPMGSEQINSRERSCSASHTERPCQTLAPCARQDKPVPACPRQAWLSPGMGCQGLQLASLSTECPFSALGAWSSKQRIRPPATPCVTWHRQLLPE